MKSWNLRHRTTTDQRVFAIEAGQVVCPNRGFMDVEDCWVCPAYRGLSTGSTEGLICSPDRTASLSVSGLDAYPAWILKR